MTSVGFGDIGPKNIVERIVCIAMILVSGISWAMVLGQVCGIVGGMNVDEQQFRTLMDSLNNMMLDRQLLASMRRRLRMFFLSNRQAQRHENHQVVMDALTPGLKGEVVLELNRTWLPKVPFLNECLVESQTALSPVLTNAFKSFMIEVSKVIYFRAYAQGEEFGGPDVLYILNRGIVIRNLRGNGPTVAPRNHSPTGTQR